MEDDKPLQNETGVSGEQSLGAPRPEAQPIKTLKDVRYSRLLNTLSEYKDVWGPLLTSLIALVSTFIALLGITFSFYLQSASLKIQAENNKQQADLKQYEVTFKIKQEVYASFMREVSDLFWKASQRDPNGLNRGFDHLQTTYYALEPFLDETSRETVWENIQLYIMFCSSVFDRKEPDSEKISATFLYYKNQFRAELYDRLFNAKLRDRH